MMDFTNQFYKQLLLSLDGWFLISFSYLLTTPSKNLQFTKHVILFLVGGTFSFPKSCEGALRFFKVSVGLDFLLLILASGEPGSSFSVQPLCFLHFSTFHKRLLPPPSMNQCSDREIPRRNTMMYRIATKISYLSSAKQDTIWYLLADSLFNPLRSGTSKLVGTCWSPEFSGLVLWILQPEDRSRNQHKWVKACSSVSHNWREFQRCVLQSSNTK